MISEILLLLVHTLLSIGRSSVIPVAMSSTKAIACVLMGVALGMWFFSRLICRFGSRSSLVLQSPSSIRSSSRTGVITRAHPNIQLFEKETGISGSSSVPFRYPVLKNFTKQRPACKVKPQNHIVGIGRRSVPSRRIVSSFDKAHLKTSSIVRRTQRNTTLNMKATIKRRSRPLPRVHHIMT